MNTTLVDSNGAEVARFEPVVAKRKFGRIQLLRSDLTQNQIDEIVFTGLAVFQDTTYYTAQYAGSGAASGAAAASAASAAAA